MNASHLAAPLGVMRCSFVNDMREIVVYNVDHDTMHVRWDTILNDGRQMFMMDFKPRDNVSLDDWLDARRNVIEKALRSFELPQEQIQQEQIHD